MKHVRVLSKAPARAADISFAAMVEFIVSVLEVLEPLLLAKGENDDL